MMQKIIVQEEKKQIQKQCHPMHLTWDDSQDMKHIALGNLTGPCSFAGQGQPGVPPPPGMMNAQTETDSEELSQIDSELENALFWGVK